MVQENNLNILYEDKHLIAVNKRSSEIVQGDSTGDIPLCDHLKQYLKLKYNKPGNVYVGVPHRLDRPVSGVVLFTRTSKALSRLNEMFRNGEVSKTYWALVQNMPPQTHDALTHYIRKNKKLNKSFISPNKKNNYKEARLTYTLIGKTNHYFLLEIDLHTGRHHQIRAQLSTIDCPVKGDIKYGSRRSNTNGSICLHARSISFIHPVRKDLITITAPLPDTSIWNACDDLFG